MYVNLENLLNNKQLGDTVNQVMNDNWQLLLHEIKGEINRVLNALLEDFPDKILAKYPYKKLFLEDDKEMR